MRHATLYTQSILLMLPQVFKITSSESFSVLTVINKYQLVFLLLQSQTYCCISWSLLPSWSYDHHYQDCDHYHDDCADHNFHYHDHVLIMILLQTHVEPLSSRVDCEGSSRQEVERGFELPPAIYQVDFLFFLYCDFRSFLTCNFSHFTFEDTGLLFFCNFLIVFLWRGTSNWISF